MEIGKLFIILAVLLIRVVPALLALGAVVYVAVRIARRKDGAVTTEGVERMLRLESLNADLQAQLAEVHERLDFMERLLVEHNELSRPAGPDQRHFTPV